MAQRLNGGPGFLAFGIKTLPAGQRNRKTTPVWLSSSGRGPVPVENPAHVKKGRRMDLKQEFYIRELRVRGHGVREIGWELGVSASTVSRVLSKPPDREQILDLTSRMEMMEKKVALLEEALYITHDAIGRVGPPYSHKMIDLFQRWPDDYFKRLRVAGKL